MSPRDERLRALFLSAADLPPVEQERLLARLGAEEPELRAELETLLRSDRTADATLAVPDPGPPSSPPQDLPERIGPYVIRGLIGEGGMGVVYLAQEAGPLGRAVAVKVLRPELSATSALGRFEAEREALAMMDHPNVARVLDAGATPEGRLYLGMEYVQGCPITEFCDAHRLTVSARLALFLQVCEGVQHAHERGIIHRDLNPANVLVSGDAATPTVKIIDFGIAKFASHPAIRRAPRTESGVLVGTPEYMSPEQIAMQPGASDTRTDVWALGLILYELSVGLLPYDPSVLRTAGLAGLRTAILEQPLPSPGARLRAVAPEDGGDLARARGVDRRALARSLRGDLGKVVLKAIERDRARRYASPGELAADLRRCLRMEPVLAGSPGLGHRLACFTRRYRRAVAAVLIAAAVVGSAGVASGIQARRASAETERAQREARLAEQLISFVVGFMTAPPTVAPRVDGTDAEEVIEAGSRAVAGMREVSPAVRAQLLFAFGDVQRRFGQMGVAAPLLAEAIEELDAALGPDSAEALAACDSMARLKQDIGRDDEAEALYRRGYAVRRDRLGEEAPDTLRALSRLGFSLFRSKQPERAEPVLAECAAGLARALGRDHPDTLVTGAYHTGVLLDLGRAREVLAAVDDLLPRARLVLGPFHMETHGLRYNRACALAQLGRRQEAIDALREVVEAGFDLGYHAVAEDSHLFSLRGAPELQEILTRARLNGVEQWSAPCARSLELRHAGRLAESESILRELLAAARRIGAERAHTFDLDYSLADLLFLQGRPEQAEPIVLSLRQEVLGAPWSAWYSPAEFSAFAAQCRLAQGDRAGAAAWLETAAAELAEDPNLGISAYVASRRCALAGDEAGAARHGDEARARGFDVHWWQPRDDVAAERAGTGPSRRG